MLSTYTMPKFKPFVTSHHGVLSDGEYIKNTAEVSGITIEHYSGCDCMRPGEDDMFIVVSFHNYYEGQRSSYEDNRCMRVPADITVADLANRLFKGTAYKAEDDTTTYFNEGVKQLAIRLACRAQRCNPELPALLHIAREW